MLANIQSFKIPITCLTAIIYLENLSERVNLLSLYQKIFPEQWLESTIPIDKQSHPASAYLDREIGKDSGLIFRKQGWDRQIIIGISQQCLCKKIN
ncbi:MAG: hypothetical protein V7K66_09130, partial [Nostoc sp.]